MNKTAVVTGASHNIGQGIAIVLAEQGYDLAITYRSNEEGARETERAIQELGRKCYVYQSTLDLAQGPQELMDRAHRDLGQIDLLVCNAANPGFRCSILTVTPEMVDDIYASNYRNYITCAGAAARYMVADKVEGNIVFITSTRAEMAYVDDYLYGSLKAAIKRATESIALDLSSYNIRVNCVAPGAIWPVKPGMEERIKSPFVTESIPLHRVGTPREIGEAVAYVASDKAAYMTGTTVRLDGGLILPGMMEGYDKIPWVREEWKKEVYDEAMKMVQGE
ncbi:MAG: SDR family oxidoreductase [Oscillospiraceae bacterium]|jgi:glucose 1-dehydrogenase|nr:SDR family oxidoreductase [Oscillospiraceae bacterium]